MARNDGVDRTVVRNSAYRKEGIGIRERHNERKNEIYSNPDIVPERSHLNVYYRKPSATYVSMLNHLLKDGTISDRGLKADAKVFGEMVFDVNTGYFERHGGYPFAKDFFAEAYRCAIEMIGGEQYVLSAVMHADERNRSLSDKLGKDVYHYHLHVVYIPVVEKEILWSKRCKDPALRGTVKERITQISNSKKWKSVPAVDEDGKPLLNEKGKSILRKSYSIMQDRFFEHMHRAGYTDIQRGEQGSTEEHLSVIDFKICQEEKELSLIQSKQEEAKTALNKMEESIENINTFVRENVPPTQELLPEAGTFESGRRYRERVLALVDKLVQIVRGLCAKYLSLKERYENLSRRYFQLDSRLDEVINENEQLRERVRDYRKVRSILGADQIDAVLASEKDHNRLKNRERRMPDGR